LSLKDRNANSTVVNPSFVRISMRWVILVVPEPYGS
jgi:hypothetical protein